MYEIVESSASEQQLATVKGLGSLHEQYGYLRLHFGRWLADVKVEPAGGSGQYRLKWLIPGGVGERPSAQEIERDLAALGWRLQMAHQQLRQQSRRPHETGLRRSLAAQVLARIAVPTTADDVRFTPSGEMVIINWCLDSSRPGGKLADCDPAQVIERLSLALRVRPQPIRRPAPSLTAPAVSPAARVTQSVSRPQSDASGLFDKPRSRHKVLHLATWPIVLAACLALGALGLAFVIGQYAGYKRGERAAGMNSEPVTEDGAIASETPLVESKLSLDFANAEAHLLPGIENDGKKDRFSFWVPINDDPLIRKAQKQAPVAGDIEFQPTGSLPQDNQGRVSPVKWWLVGSVRVPGGSVVGSFKWSVKEVP